ncbi:hypothetical protein KGQ19_48865, partial [Catenulispora sp. NL8]
MPGSEGPAEVPVSGNGASVSGLGDGAARRDKRAVARAARELEALAAGSEGPVAEAPGSGDGAAEMGVLGVGNFGARRERRAARELAALPSEGAGSVPVPVLAAPRGKRARAAAVARAARPEGLFSEGGVSGF